MVESTQNITKLPINNDLNLTDKITTIKNDNNLENITLNNIFNNEIVKNLIAQNIVDSVKNLFLGDLYFNIDNAFKNKPSIDVFVNIGTIKFKKVYLMCDGKAIADSYAIKTTLGRLKTPDFSRGGVLYGMGSSTSNQDKNKGLGTFVNGGLPVIEWNFNSFVRVGDGVSMVQGGFNTRTRERWVDYNETHMQNASGTVRKVGGIEYNSSGILPTTEDNKVKMDNFLGQWYILADIIKV